MVLQRHAILAVLVLVFVFWAGMANSAEYILSGSSISDGWINASSKDSSFTGDTIKCDGNPYDSYYKGLIKFDLKSIKASRFARVHRATLRLKVTDSSNPGKIPTTISALNTPWSVKADVETSDSQNKWPVREGYPNIVYAAIPYCSSSTVISSPGIINIDVTGTVDRWLYQNMPNNGFLISTGGPVFGKPDIGSWKLSFASSESGVSGPQLIVEMEGTKPGPGSAKSSALRYYPSALLPPVKSPYIFYWDFGAAPTFRGSVTNAHGGGEPSAQQAGRLTLGWFYGPQDPYIKDERGFIDYYVNAAKSDTLGIMVDEWQNPVKGEAPLDPAKPFGITGSIKGILAAKKTNPAFYIAVAWRGEDNIEGATRYGQPDLLMIEAYSHVENIFPREWGTCGDLTNTKRRIDTARKLGMIEQTIPWFGMILAPEKYHAGDRLTADELERQIAEIRTYAPEMPGVAFYANSDQALANSADRLAYKYFVEPAPELTIAEPAFEARISTPHQMIRVDARPKSKHKVVRYRWFVDNRLIAETSSSEYAWDTRGEQSGVHIITVHAVDDAFNRGVAQIPVRLLDK